MTDVLLRQTADGGEIDFANGQPALTDGIETAVILSLFGGNEEDSGLEADDAKQWWGNLTEQEPARRFRSETQFLLRSLTATTANLRRVDYAAARDLAWMADSVAVSVEVTASMPAKNQIGLEVAVNVNGRVVRVSMIEQWGTAQP